ncbi:MerR family transcriptional regulator [Paenibacillus sp. RRE4]|uniref:MerR family transcriptional regulator n=1 Tax=Paenibacillus sp. RRE4 TaxID=2962587 RepID=UPI00288234EC|nr:MerR family transcriptional regulator [Paenibacillus sp. RRE4]MDT0122920.1 MerR family transcriptional regulator [Paenibacillus sp. RRE4]
MMRGMKDEITISELAKLMQVSVHQIRYFEEKGVLTPAYTGENQYRMYGMDQVYRLAHILLLRKMGLSVQVIQECLSHLTVEQITPIFRQALSDTEAEIQRLQDTKHFIEKLLEEKEWVSQKSALTEGGVYAIIQRDEVPLSLWFEMQEAESLSAQTLVKHGSNISNLFEADIHYVYNDSGIVGLYTQEERRESNLTLRAGSYLSSTLFVQNEERLSTTIQEFYAYAEEMGYLCSGPLVMVEKSYLSLFTPELLHYELLSYVSNPEAGEL